MSSTGEIRLSAAALQHNARALRSITPPGRQVAAVVKANAYGHGMAEVVPVLDSHVDAFQVDDLDELRELRKLTGKRALVFGYVLRESVEEALSLGCELTVFDRERLDAIEAAGTKLKVVPKVHLKVDALLGRLGVVPKELPGFLFDLKQRKIEVVAAYAHYANIEDTTDPSHAAQQECAFENALRRIRKDFPGIGRHLSATSGLLAREGQGQRNDLVRLGIGLYGLYPSAALAKSHRSLELRPVLTWASMLAQVKVLPNGHPVGYGLTYRTPREMPVGIVPQGYADGYDRGLSNSGEVLVRGRRCPVIGRIAMNMIAVDLSSVPDARAEDEVVLLGSQGEAAISLEEIAAKLGTINYEIVARISPLLPRRLIE